MTKVSFDDYAKQATMPFIDEATTMTSGMFAALLERLRSDPYRVSQRMCHHLRDRGVTLAGTKAWKRFQRVRKGRPLYDKVQFKWITIDLRTGEQP